MVWAIGSEDRYEDLSAFVDQMGLTYPLLYDENAVVQDLYNPGRVPTNSKYPQDWIIGADGRVKYVNTIYDPDEMMAVLDAEFGLE